MRFRILLFNLLRIRIIAFLWTLLSSKAPFHFDGDPDPAFHFVAGPDLRITLMRIRIQLSTLMPIGFRIQLPKIADPDPASQNSGPGSSFPKWRIRIQRPKIADPDPQH
jgi:hypothetical protein